MVLYSIYVYYYKTGLSAQDHGSINRFVFISSGFIILLVYIFVKTTLKIIRNSEKLFATLFITLSGVVFYVYYMRFYQSCDGWSDGLADHELVNTEDV